MEEQPRILYYSFNGLTEDLGKSQVLEYLIILSEYYKIELITFEKHITEEEIEEIESLIDGRLNWYRLKYSNKFGSLSTIGSLYKGLQLGRKICKKKEIDIIHCRSMLPSLIGMQLKKELGCKLLFDIRGFATDEKVDRGRIKKNSLTYKLLSWLEDKLYTSSDHVVTLTYKAKKLLIDEYSELTDHNVTVIPTCASKETFRKIDNVTKNEFRKKIGFHENDIIFIHTGNVGTWYDLETEMKLINALKSRNERVKFILLNRGQHEYILEVARNYELGSETIHITESEFTDVYKYLNIADFSLFFIHPSYSKQASAPTKFAENVRCHLPTISNSDVGDMEYFLTKYKVGLCFELSEVKQNAQMVASNILHYYENYNEKLNHAQFESLFHNEFDKDLATKKYSEIYSDII